MAGRPLLAQQTANFECRATQGVSWYGNSKVIAERIDISILPDHLDVEHELEINTGDRGNSPIYPNSLEILGSLTMAKGTVITGLLLWNGDKILKGKLQTKEMARRKYEEVVDRNVKDPPKPRDPAILEKTNENKYALSIFPVSLYGSRKIRIRYLIPSFIQDGSHRIAFPHAFSGVAQVSVRGGSGVSGYALRSVYLRRVLGELGLEEAINTPVTLEDSTPVTLDPKAYQLFSIHWGQPPWFIDYGGSHIYAITPLFGVIETSRAFVGSMRDVNGTAGHVAHFIFSPPSEFIDLASGPGKRIVAVIRAGSDSVLKEINGFYFGQNAAEELRIFSHAAFEDSITWRIYTNDVLITEKNEKPHLIRLEDGNQYARCFGGTPFYPLVKSMPSSLAAAWGFIDSKYALLALEQDTLQSAVAQQYAKAGVPGLDPEDIYAEEGHLDSIPLSAWSLQRNFDRDKLLEPLAIAASGLPSGIRWSFRDGRVIVEIDRTALARGLRVSLHGLDGKLLKEWSANEVSNGRLDWSPRKDAYVAGICLLRVVSGSQAFSARVILR